MYYKGLLAAVLGLVCMGFAQAQNPPKPGPEHEKLKKLVGTWDTVMEMQGQKSKGTATYTSICNGMWLANKFEGEAGGGKFEGHGLDGYDLDKKRHVGIWVDSWSSAPMNFAGNVDADSKLLVMTGETTKHDGMLEKFKTTTEMKDDDHMTFKMYMVGADGKDTLAFTIEYSRRK